jgi:hypothetical protein
LVEAKVTTFRRGWQAAARRPCRRDASLLLELGLYAAQTTGLRKNALLHCSMSTSRPVEYRHIGGGNAGDDRRHW